jgi:hypothetical protein
VRQLNDRQPAGAHGTAQRPKHGRRLGDVSAVRQRTQKQRCQVHALASNQR